MQKGRFSIFPLRGAVFFIMPDKLYAFKNPDAAGKNEVNEKRRTQQEKDGKPGVKHDNLGKAPLLFLE
jgi:hypothetical protein